ncbi:AAA family ATPase [Clostridium septicum]|uniref:AAA family ATPase n=1 Tax=Clostridium septicum TaxID=1504 RepID=UPI001FAA1C51|nr:AAA family ATPase [Clostridium septicum]
MIHSIEINNFRALEGIKLILGKHVTALSGRNGIGKSTILALLGNTCEIKGKQGKTLLNTQFRTEFSEIFKGSELFDKSGSNKCRVNFVKK